MDVFKCEYCEKRPSRKFNNELLCGYHFRYFYVREEFKNQNLIDVYKTQKEEEFAKKYMHFLKNHDFRDTKRTEKVLVEFRRDVRKVVKGNSMYQNINN